MEVRLAAGRRQRALQAMEVAVVVINVRADPKSPPAGSHGDPLPPKIAGYRIRVDARPFEGDDPRKITGAPRAMDTPACLRSDLADSLSTFEDPARYRFLTDLRDQSHACSKRVEARHVEGASLPALSTPLEG